MGWSCNKSIRQLSSTKAHGWCHTFSSTPNFKPGLRTIRERLFQAHEQLSVREDDVEHQEASCDKLEGISQEGDKAKLQIENCLQ